MTLFTQTQTEQLLDNCQAQIVRMDNAEDNIDFTPVVKLFTPDRPDLRRAAHGHARLGPVPEGLQAGALVVSGAPLLHVLKKFRPCHLTELYVNKRVFAYSLTIIVGACLICGSLKAR
jgi:hypothetical protein